ncbi:MAG: molybdopterin-dependent oxidoreductase [Deferribacteraceae bacterium]|jgi:anaerobic dimethyl sulfoxide reductase subunit A|nr:molybdopterin-dependent oxidoreductase [Deferribacteraceae bacterium]
MKSVFPISRRDLLKSAGAIVASAAVAGCGSNDSEDTFVSPMDGLVFDRELKTCFSSGPYNCGARCMHKIHYKNNRLVHLTSAGDIERDSSRSSDESPGEIGLPIQRRACVRGYSYLQRLYQPDRLKYPLIQTGNKGDISTFKRVSWEVAIEKAADALHAAIQRKATLGYSPIMCKWAGSTIDTFNSFVNHPDVAPIITHLGNESYGAVDAAKFDMVGVDSFTNNVTDRYNSQFIITWALDPSRTSYHIEQAHWFNTCAKEWGIPIVVITPNHSDTAAMLSTGVPEFTYTAGSTKTVDIPAWIPIRPATDGALAAAMAYVIYKNSLHNTTFLTSSCFGFFKDQQTTSTSARVIFPNFPPKNYNVPNDFSDDASMPATFTKGSLYAGAVFKVPAGESFEEYLISLENDWGGAVGNTAGGTTAAVGDPTYNQVLEYAAALTGVPSDTIEALAFKYARPGPGLTAGPAFMDVGGGPQRAWNGVEWVQMMIALCAMTGNTNRSGGGAGFSMGSCTDYPAAFAPVAPSASMLNNIETVNAISVPMGEWSHLALTGKDYRSRDRFIADVKICTGGTPLKDPTTGFVVGVIPKTPLDLTGRPDPLVEVDVWFINNYNGVTTLENINKTIAAVKSVKTVICCDQTMTPTAAYSDIIFPVTSHYESEGVAISYPGTTAMFKMDAPLDKMYDAKSDNSIRNLILSSLMTRYGYNFDPDTDFYSDLPKEYSGMVAQGTYEALKGPGSFYTALVDPSATAKTYEEFCRDGVIDYPIPKGKAVVGFQHFNPLGDLQNTTGRINFWQPLWGKIRPKTTRSSGPDYWGRTHDGFRNPTAKYQPNIEGYEKFFDNGPTPGPNFGNPLKGSFTGFYSKLSGRYYKLLYITNKARHRAHTVFDNVAVIKDQNVQCVFLNPADAAERGINDGDMVYVYNDRGCTYIPAKVTHYIAPGVISVEHGAWYRPHPTETVKVWIDTARNADGIWNPSTVYINGEPDFREFRVPIDVGGAENVLTLNVGGTEQYVGQAISAQGGPCEVSRTKPE